MRGIRLDPWPPLAPSAYARRRARALPFPLEEPGVRVFHRARQGLWHAVRAHGLEPGDEVLVPAYHHGSEVEALVRAGLTCRFYEATDDLVPDAAELESLRAPRTRALHLVHYGGLPQDAARWRRWCDERGLLLIEDAAQAWLAERDGAPAGAYGDIAIFSLYKTFGLPDGGAVLARAPLPEPGRALNLQPLRVAQRHKAWTSQRWGTRDKPPGAVPMEEVVAGARRSFELPADPLLPASALTRHLVPRMVDPSAPERRRANYHRLLGELRELVPPPFDAPPAGASPFVLPVRSGDKEALLQQLRRHGVIGLNLWLVPHPALPAERFPKTALRRSQDVGLPVHQELTPRHLDQVLRAVGA